MWINCGKKSTPVDNLIGLEKNCKNITNLKGYRGVDKKTIHSCEKILNLLKEARKIIFIFLLIYYSKYTIIILEIS